MITDETTEFITNILHNNNKLKQCNISHNNMLEIDLIKKMLVSHVTKLRLSNERAVYKLSILITDIKELNMNNINSPSRAGAFKVFEKLSNISTVKNLASVEIL